MNEIALDFETTGLSPGDDRILEIGAARLDEYGQVSATFESLVAPDRPISARSRQIHGLDEQALRDAPTAAEVWPRFLTWVGPAEYVRLVAHKARVEAGFLGLALEREGLDGSGLRVGDTLAAARWWMPKRHRHGLRDLTADLGFGSSAGPHRALEDARRVAALWAELKRRGLDPATADCRELPVYRLGPAPMPEGWDWLERAIAAGEPVAIHYHGGTKGPGVRVVTPRAIVEQGGRDYLDAICHQAGRRKSFRLDRIHQADGGTKSEPGLVPAGERR